MAHVRLLCLAMVSLWPHISLAFVYDDSDRNVVAELRSGRITDEQMMAEFDQRASRLIVSCNLVEWSDYKKQAGELQRYYRLRIPAGVNTRTPISRLGMNLADIRDACEPPTDDFREAISYADQCELALSHAVIDRLGALADDYLKQANLARGAGRFARVPFATAKSYSDQMKSAHQTALTALNKAVERCAKLKPPAPAAVPVPAAPPTEPTAAAPVPDGVTALVGRWTNRKYGGSIDVRAEKDGTLSVVIVTANDRMRSYGFSAGMPILRRLKPAQPNSLWSSSAGQGEYFSAAMPGRKAGEPYGEAYWDLPASIYIAVDRPGRLELPATLGGRLANYEAWVRE